MEFKELVELVQDQPSFESGLLLSGSVDPGYIRKQLSIWIKNGKIIQLKRGVYVLAQPFQKIHPHPFVIANRLYFPSYVSYQSALSYYGLIPEGVYSFLSASTRKTKTWETQIGVFNYHSMQTGWFHGYTSLEVDDRQFAFIPLPEKALLDLIFLTPQGDSPAYLEELRLQNLGGLDLSIMESMVDMARKPKLTRFFTCFRYYYEKQNQGNHTL